MSSPSFSVLKAVEARLASAHPAAFSRPVPLAVDCLERLMAEHPDLGRTKLSSFLGRWVSTRAYLEALISESERIDIDGAVKGTVAYSERANAQTLLYGRPDGDPRDRLEGERARALYETSSLFRSLIAILEEAPIERPLGGEAAALVRAVMAFHPNPAKFGGAAPVPMVVLASGKRCFGWRREDGYIDTFSILKCAMRAEEDQRSKGLAGER